jgi:cell wall assembly regulator SMI1
MNELRIEQIVAKLKKNPPATKEMIASVSKVLGLQFPKEYEQLLLIANGASGFLAADGRYLLVYPIEKLPELNKGYLFSELCPHLVLFGSDGGANGFSFDTREQAMPVAMSDFVCPDEARVVATSFAEFLLRLSAGDRFTA